MNIILIAALAVYISDLSGFPDSVKEGLTIIFGRRVVRLKPLDCSLCMTWWATLIYTIAAHKVSVPNIALCALLSFLSSEIAGTLRLVKEAAAFIIRKIINKL